MGGDSRDIHLRIGREELVIRQRYQFISIANDVLIGLWFLIGSFMFFSESLTYSGTWLFVIGSVEMLIRPVIRLIRHPTCRGSAGPGPRRPIRPTTSDPSRPVDSNGAVGAQSHRRHDHAAAPPLGVVQGPAHRGQLSAGEGGAG